LQNEASRNTLAGAARLKRFEAEIKKINALLATKEKA